MKRLEMAAAAVIATLIQVAWASPDAVSALDLSTSPNAYLPWMGLLAVAVAAVASACSRPLPANWRTLPVALALAGYWLLLDVFEFSIRVAAWSTFSTSSLWLYTLRSCVIPLLACTAAFALYLHWRRQRLLPG